MNRKQVLRILKTKVLKCRCDRKSDELLDVISKGSHVSNSSSSSSASHVSGTAMPDIFA